MIFLLQRWQAALIVFVLIASLPLNGRWRRRVEDPCTAEVRTRLLDGVKEYVLKGYEFETSALFTLFDYNHFMENMLPSCPIAIRNDPEKKIDGKDLTEYVEECYKEILKTKQRTKTFKHFTVLKKSNFNFKKSTGLIIFRLKNSPYDNFVVKLFIETPRDFVRPFTKDLEQNCLYCMGGGISRYLVGFTRIRNLHYIKSIIAKSPYWSSFVDTPRKWFWIPRSCRWFEVKGYKIGGKPEQYTCLPSVYAIVTDAIEAARILSKNNPTDTRKIISLVQWLGQRLDPNIQNYMIEKKTGKLVFVDTEHFPSNLGLRAPLKYNDHGSWYNKLVRKYFKDNFFRTKSERLAIRDGRVQPIMECTEA